MAAGPASSTPVAANQQLHQPFRLEYAALIATARRLLDDTFVLDHLLTTPNPQLVNPNDPHNCIVIYALYGSFAMYQDAVNSLGIAPVHKTALLMHFDTHLSAYLKSKSQYILTVFSQTPDLGIQNVRDHPQIAQFGVVVLHGMAHIRNYMIGEPELDSHAP